jgi:hypothetical protein
VIEIASDYVGVERALLFWRAGMDFESDEGFQALSEERRRPSDMVLER